MKKHSLCFLFLCFLLIQVAFTQSTTNPEINKNDYQIKEDLIATGVIIGSNSSSYNMSSTAGQLVVDSVGNFNYSMYFGFWYQYPNIVDALDYENLLLPKVFDLKQNYPNPFNPETIIEYAVPRPGEVIIEVFNILGQKVAVLLNKKQHAGFYEVKWSGNSKNGNYVANGLYFYRMVAQTAEGKVFAKTKKMIFLK